MSFRAGRARSGCLPARRWLTFSSSRATGTIASYAGVAGLYAKHHGVDGSLAAAGHPDPNSAAALLVLSGLKTRWAAIALFGFCLLTALFFHTASDQVIELQKNVAMAGGFLTLAILGPGPWSLDAWRGRAG